MSASVCKGDPVIVHGTLTTHEWESDSGPRSKPRIKAFAVGPNLQKGRSAFTRDRSTARVEEQVDAIESAPFGVEPEEGAPVSIDEVSIDEASIDGLVAGRDYEVEGEALDLSDADLPREPAHA